MAELDNPVLILFLHTAGTSQAGNHQNLIEALKEHGIIQDPG
jgi:hypothetical protein